MANHTGSEGTVKVGSNTIAEIRSFSIDETHDADIGGSSGRAHMAALGRDIQRFFDTPTEADGRWVAPSAPPGSPIGDPGLAWIAEPFCSQPDQPFMW